MTSYSGHSGKRSMKLTASSVLQGSARWIWRVRIISDKPEDLSTVKKLLCLSDRLVSSADVTDQASHPPSFTQTVCMTVCQTRGTNRDLGNAAAALFSGLISRHCYPDGSASHMGTSVCCSE